MPNYQLTNSKINLGSNWKISKNFKHKNEFVDSNDNPVSKDHNGRCYELIKYTRNFSYLEKLARKIGAALLTICSIGGIFLPPSLKKIKTDLLEKEYESKRFKVLTSFSDLSMICPDIVHSILSYLNPVELEKCLLVSKQWQKLADQENLWNNFSYPNCTFGQEQWDQYFGLKVSANSPIPRNLIKLLESPCIVSKGKKIKDTHLLVHIPKTANDNPFNFEMFSHDEYLKERDYLFLDYGVCLDKTYESHWVLMSKNIRILKDNTYLSTVVSDKYKIRLSSLPKKFKLNNSAPNILDDIICKIIKHILCGSKQMKMKKIECKRFYSINGSWHQIDRRKEISFALDFMRNYYELLNDKRKEQWPKYLQTAQEEFVKADIRPRVPIRIIPFVNENNNEIIPS